MSTHRVPCPDCNEIIRSADVDLGLMLAKCASCDAVFSFAEHVGRSEDQTVAHALSTTDPRPAMPDTHPVKEVHTSDGLALSYRWWQWRYLYLLFFICFWDGFLVMWWTIALAEGEFQMAAFSLLHVAVGFGLTYYTLAGLLNRTKVTIGFGRLTVRHGPLPWTGNRDIPTESLEQLYIVQRITRNNNNTSITYDLKAHTQWGTDLTIVKGAVTAEAARFLEQRIERLLGITDREVAGEHLS